MPDIQNDHLNNITLPDAETKAEPNPVEAATAEPADEESFEILPGMRLQVSSVVNRHLFHARVTGFNGNAVTLIDINGGDVPRVMYNTVVKMRGSLPGMRTLVCYGSVCGSTDKLWKVDQLSGKAVPDQRNFFRQSVSIPAKVMCVNQIFSPENTKNAPPPIPSPCTILDISGSGLMFSAKEKFVGGDWVFVMEANLNGEQNFSFSCQVLRVVVNATTSTYGCRFEGLSRREQDRLIQAIFSLQRKDKRNDAP